MNVASLVDRKNTNLLPCSDLMWDLSGVQDKEIVTSFLKSFQKDLCVMVPSVRRLYANYSIESASQHDRLRVLPSSHAYQDIFNAIPEEAMLSTNFFIVPGGVVNKAENHLYLAWRKAGSEMFSHSPLSSGLEWLMLNASLGNPFLPVICTRDLRFLRKKTPILRLSRLSVKRLGHLPSFQINDIAHTIETKLFGVAKVA